MLFDVRINHKTQKITYHESKIISRIIINLFTRNS